LFIEVSIVTERQGFALIFGAKAVLFARYGVLGVINASPQKKGEFQQIFTE
jgi:hypothetical protein